MRCNKSIWRGFKAMAAALAVVAFATALVQPAGAGCLQYNGIKKTASNLQAPESSAGSARFIRAAYTQIADEESAPDWDHRHDAPIVGLWFFKYISKGNLSTLGIPDGALIDGGNTLWYADGNEVTYSGVRDPSTGSVCLGVWKQTGERTYVLNHIGLSWNPTASPPAAGGPAFIKQHVTLDKDGNGYTGTFEINQLKPDGKTPALPAPIKGSIVATRVTITTDTQEL
jgi:hypothetical protein